MPPGQRPLRRRHGWACRAAACGPRRPGKASSACAAGPGPSLHRLSAVPATRSRNRRMTSKASPAFPPLQHAQRAEGVPTAGRTQSFQFKVGLALVAVLQRPAAVLAPSAADDVDRSAEALVTRRVDGLEVIESAEDVVGPARRERDAKEYGLDDVAGTLRAKEPVHQEELTATALRSPDR